ncbi:hypothetical protein K458DRAFT_176765 [Lentithecium fluviatile CBS 122367]|uniref:Uncharacterized protein n=1 Tax=Lentithecium fluviatile CBS 122367 TaxID=1168545 RepID=A0A6G1JDL0_9PLEO|nr:hypothetical protein K458DRAFT_176765 [Lentithecium fluviatile CBS 122367]
MQISGIASRREQGGVAFKVSVNYGACCMAAWFLGARFENGVLAFGRAAAWFSLLMTFHLRGQRS